MSRVGRNRKRVNGTLLTRGQTITFERLTKSGDCFTGGDGIRRCKNENKGLIFNRKKFIEPSKAKPTEKDNLKSISEIEPKCFTNSFGDKICKDDKGKKINIATGKAPKGNVRRGKVRQDIIDQVKNDPLKATFTFKDKAVEWILTNENKFRAAKVLADATSLGLIAVGSIILATTSATGVGAVIGGGIAGAGVGLGAASSALGKGVDAIVLTAKRIKQIEDAIEVARQTLTPKDDRQELIEQNKVVIDKRAEELLDLSKTELKEKAKLLEIKGISSLSTTNLAREIAIFETIGSKGLDEVEPKVGRSLLESNIKDLTKITDNKKSDNQKIKDIMEERNVDEVEAQRLLEIIKLRAKLKEEKEDKKTKAEKVKQQALASLLKELEDITALEDLEEQDERERLVKLNAPSSPRIGSIIDDLIDEDPSDDDEVPPSPPQLSTAGLNIEEEDEEKKVIVDDSDIQTPSQFLIGRVNPIASTIGDTKSPKIGQPIITETTSDTFQFTEISNEDIINGASRAKIEKAMKTNLLTKPKNFNNHKILTAEQIQGATGTNPIAKQRAAVINANNDVNYYKELQKEIAHSKSNKECMDYLTANKSKINMLSKTLQAELKRFCESILDDDN